MLKIFNTLGKKLEEFKSIKPKEVLFYQCGPTVYWTQHIGNMRAMVMGDFVRRSLIYLGYKVNYVRNYTDFGHLTGDNLGDADLGEDRMEKAAKRESLTPQAIADKYINEFEKDTRSLNIMEPTVKARATDYIVQMIDMVRVLIEKDYAYTTPKAIYFDTSKFPHYTDLSGRDLEKNKKGAGSGDIVDVNKRNSADFAVWFFKTGPHKNALQYWKSPFKSIEVENGEGFPGWHLECSAMVLSNLGKTVDIHMGGVEHISIHHTNEIAQSEAANEVKYVNYWLHNEHLLVDGKKMAKSEGTSFIIKDIVEKGYKSIHLKYLFLQAHYRSIQNFTWESLEGAKIAYEKLLNILVISQSAKVENTKNPRILEEWKLKFERSLDDDFNLPLALSLVWDLIKSNESQRDIVETIYSFDEVFGLNLMQEVINLTAERNRIKDEVEILIKKRNDLKKKGDFLKADGIRDQLKKEFNVELLDSRNGTEWLIS